jgi:hypothetical protein
VSIPSFSLRTVLACQSNTLCQRFQVGETVPLWKIDYTTELKRHMYLLDVCHLILRLECPTYCFSLKTESKECSLSVSIFKGEKLSI